MKKLLMLFVLLGLFISCSEPTKTEKEDENNIVLTDEAATLTESEVESISDITDSTITLTSEIKKIEVGTIIAGGISDKTPFGFLRKVTQVSQDGLTVNTTPAALNEYIKKGKIEIKTSMFDKGLNKLNLGKSATVQSVAGDLFSYQYTLDNFVVYDLDEDEYTTQDQIRMNGAFLFSAGIDATADIFPAEITMSGEAHAELNLRVEAELAKPDINAEKRIGQPIYLTPIVTPVGIWVTPVIEAFAGVRGYIYANANVEIKDNLDLSGEVHYLDGWDDPVTSVTNEFEFVELSANLNTELRGYVKAKISYVIMELIGPSVSASPYLEPQVHIDQVPWWKLYAGSEGAIGIKMGVIFFFLDDYEVPIVDQSFLLAQAQTPANNPPSKVTVSEPANGETNVAVNKTFDWQPVTDPDGDPVTYDLLLGTQQPLERIAQDLTETSFTPGNPLYYETTYYYQILSKDNHGNTTESDVWSFTTQKQAEKIAFVARCDSRYDVYVANFDGSNEVRLTYEAGTNLDLSFSPNMKKIAFRSHRDGNTDVHIINSDGSGRVNLTTNCYKSDWHPSWSPDGTKISFTSDRDGASDIFIMNANGSNPVNLTKTYSIGDWHPSWSSDGSKIIYITATDNGENHQINMIDVDGSNETRLTKDSSVYYNNPVWSPDGKKIAYVSHGGTRGTKSNIYIMNPDGTNEERLTNFDYSIWGASWSPDSDKLGFIYHGELYTINKDGSNLTKHNQFNHHLWVFNWGSR